MRLPRHEVPKFDEAALLERCRNGDRAAQNTLLDAYYDLVRGLLFRLAGSDNELDDLVQVVLMRIVGSLASFRGEAALSSWIRGICVHVVRDHFRRKRTRRIVQSTPDIEQPGLAPVVRPATAEARESVRAVERALARLSDNHRTALVLRLYYGHSIDEIAAMMKSAKSTTRLRLYYARKAFLRAIEQEDL